MSDYKYTYILAPDQGNNKEIMYAFAQQFPDLVEEQRVKDVSKKDAFDVLDAEGTPIARAGAKYFYMKVTASEFDPSMLEGVTDPRLFNRDNQPFNEYWL